MTILPTAAPASFVPLSAIAFSDDAQNGQAVSAAQPLPVRGFRDMDFAERLVREGQPFSSFGHGSANVAAGDVLTKIASATSGIALPLIGRAAWIETVTVQTGSRILGQFWLQANANGQWVTSAHRFLGTGLTFPMRQLLRAHELLNGGLDLYALRLLDDNGLPSAAARDVWGAVTVQGYMLTDDFNYDAEKTILAIGDSILIGGTDRGSRSANLWTFKARDHLAAQGKTARIVQMANNGSRTSDHEIYRAGGRYDGVDADLVIYAVGVNDAINGVAASTYRANLAAMWAHKQRRWPDATMIVAGPSPLENAASHANADALRAEAADFVADTGHAKLKYVNLGTAFSRTDASYYAASDAAGSRVHPDDDGHAAIAAAFNAQVDAQGITL